MQFKRIRLSGFKSFVDPTELHIEPGLTGVVGPNGCGKSNLLESLRWVMGENRAKSMRGAGMDDVIFAGTAKRPPRNLADVTLSLDNSSRTAPSAFNDADIIEVTRRIERDAGSIYRINGREVRAKDVQLLFADAATGAHSPALVSQGRVGELISAKPRNRRAILEEAAGISGLHSRRKEAEMRLRAAEKNLTRVDDVMGQMDMQIAGLRRQARQATRYRNISGDIERAAGTVLYVKWRAAADQVTQLEAELRQAETSVAGLTEIVTKLSAEQASLAADLPELRQAEAEAAAALHRITVARENLDADEQRLKAQKLTLETRITQLGHDSTRETELARDARETLARLETETRELKAAIAGQAEEQETARETLNVAANVASEAEQELDELSQQAAAAEARRDSLKGEIIAARGRVGRLEDEAEMVGNQIRDLTERDQSIRALNDAETAIATAQAAHEVAAKAVAAAEEARIRDQDARVIQADVVAALSSDLKAFEAESRTLADMISATEIDGVTPVADQLTVASGYETALGAALGDDLEAPAGSGHTRYWTTETTDAADDPALPPGTTALADKIKGGPASLMRRLAQIGVIAADKAEALAKTLKPGQRLVTTEGAVWRWDGFRAAADAPSLAAVRLAQKNRIAELVTEIAVQTQKTADAASAMTALNDKANTAIETEKAARRARLDREAEIAAAQRAHAEIEREAAKRSTRLTSLNDMLARLNRDLEEALEHFKTAEAAHANLGDDTELKAAIETLKTGVAEKRTTLAEARSRFDGLHREVETRKLRLDAISADRDGWAGRVSSAEIQLKELADRKAQATEELAAIDNRPEDFEAKRAALLTELSAADARRSQAADALAAAETKLAAKDAALRNQQADMASSREVRVRIETGLEAAKERRHLLEVSSGEDFQCPPTHLPEKIKLKDPENLPPLEAVEARLDRLKRERERLGAVNLRADEELNEIGEQLEHLRSEKADLEAAIHRLRGAIGSLNREGRERLLAAFETVNAHFGELFSTLFGGGHAYLELTESDDPLEAGLEIMASPPGKKLQNLGLLSGGEQALTALSLIFAVFMTNPAPICVLDEVDAPLDDANVERFCDLLDEMTRRTTTRFLIVTHNAITMARLDRLFGVTMAERGISTLVSVDLEAADELLAAE